MYSEDPSILPINEAEARSQGERLLAETIAAHGGDAFLNLQNLTLTGSGEFTTPPQIGGMTIPFDSFTFHIARGGRCRLEARSFGGRLVIVNRGHGRGGFAMIAGRTLELPVEQTNGMEPTELLRAAAIHKYPVLAVPTTPEDATPEGVQLLRYDVHPPHNSTNHFYIEPDTKRTRKMVTVTPRGEMTILMSGYGTLAIPEVFGVVQLLENGASIFKLIASDVTLDQPLKDVLFEQP